MYEHMLTLFYLGCLVLLETGSLWFASSYMKPHFSKWKIQAQSGLGFESSQTLLFFTEKIKPTIIAICTLPNSCRVNIVKISLENQMAAVKMLCWSQVYD